MFIVQKGFAATPAGSCRDRPEILGGFRGGASWVSPQVGTPTKEVIQ